MVNKEFETLCDLIEKDAKFFIESFQEATIRRGFAGYKTMGQWWYAREKGFADEFNLEADIKRGQDPYDFNFKGATYMVLSQPDSEGKAFLSSTGTAHKDFVNRNNPHFFVIYANHSLLLEAVRAIQAKLPEEMTQENIAPAVEMIDTLTKRVCHWRDFNNYPENADVYTEWGIPKTNDPIEMNHPKIFPKLLEDCSQIFIKADSNPRKHLGFDKNEMNLMDFIASYEPKADDGVRLPPLGQIAISLSSFYGLRIENLTENSFQLVRSVPPTPRKWYQLSKPKNTLPYEDGDKVATLEYLPSDSALPIVKLTLHADGHQTRYANRQDKDLPLDLWNIPNGNHYTTITALMYDLQWSKMSDNIMTWISYASTNDLDRPVRNDPTFLEQWVPYIIANYLTGTWSMPDLTGIRQELKSLRLEATSNHGKAYNP